MNAATENGRGLEQSREIWGVVEGGRLVNIQKDKPSMMAYGIPIHSLLHFITCSSKK